MLKSPPPLDETLIALKDMLCVCVPGVTKALVDQEGVCVCVYLE